jgi:hypothetical protein
MASVWIHDKDRLQKLKGHMPVEKAKAHLDALLMDWRKRGGTVVRIDALEAVVKGPDGNTIAGLYVEAYSPPSAPEPGQPKRVRA